MARRYRGGTLKKCGSPLADFIPEKAKAWDAAMESYQPHAAIEAAMEIAVRCNAHVEETAPWKLAKDESQAAQLDSVLYTLAESLRILSILLEPFIPEQAAAMRAQLNWTAEPSTAATEWGLLPDGHQLSEPVPLFPRIEPQP